MAAAAWRKYRHQKCHPALIVSSKIFSQKGKSMAAAQKRRWQSDGNLVKTSCKSAASLSKLGMKRREISADKCLASVWPAINENHGFINVSLKEAT